MALTDIKIRNTKRGDKQFKMTDGGGVLTTFTSYGEVSDRRQGEIIQGFISSKSYLQFRVDDIPKAVMRELEAKEAG